MSVPPVTIQAPRAAASTVAASVTSAQSAALSGRDIIVISPADCFVLFGTNPTATTSCLLVPADTPIRFTNINGGEKFAVILGSSTATVQYFEAL
jgi:hypothetical protein